MKHRVIVVEPSEVVQNGIRMALEGGNHWEVADTLSDMTSLEERIVVTRADAVIINPMVAEYSHRAHIPTLISDKVAVLALAVGYIDAGVASKFAAVIDIYEPAAKIEQHLDEALLRASDEESVPDQSELSEREKEILIELVRGKMNKEVAAMFGISIHTVISHRKNITRKTGIKSISGLTVYSLLNHLIDI